MGNNKKKSDSGNFLVQGSILAAAGIIPLHRTALQDSHDPGHRG